MERNRPEHSFGEPATLEELERWRAKNPVEIPEEIIKEREHILSRLEAAVMDNDQSAYEAILSQLNKLNHGTSDQALLYRLVKLRSLDAAPGEGVLAQIAQLEDDLRDCWCGSRERTMHCSHQR